MATVSLDSLFDGSPARRRSDSTSSGSSSTSSSSSSSSSTDVGEVAPHPSPLHAASKDVVAAELAHEAIEFGRSVGTTVRQLVPVIAVAKSSQTPTSESSTPTPRALPSGRLPPGHKPSPNDFTLLKVIGRGAYGKVLLVQHVLTGVYAMKVLEKASLLADGQVAYTVTERDIMTRLRHPYVVPLRYAFQVRGCNEGLGVCCPAGRPPSLTAPCPPMRSQTPDKLFLVSDFCEGGELFHHLRKQGLVSGGRCARVPWARSCSRSSTCMPRASCTGARAGPSSPLRACYTAIVESPPHIACPPPGTSSRRTSCWTRRATSA